MLALASAAAEPGESFVVAHVVHDLRSEAEALADRDGARRLAESLELPFVEGRVAVRGQRGNHEGVARRLRYAALERLARENRCRYLATAHQADDQLESLLMALIRGSGPRGLAGVASSRRRPSCRVIRPMLDQTRAESERLCRDAGWAWREDATNRDESRLRAALRAQVMPVLERLRPGASRRAARAARLMSGAARLVGEQAAMVAERASCDGGFAWDRRELRRAPEVVIGEALRRAAACLNEGACRDRIGIKLACPAVRAIRSRVTDSKRFAWPGVDLLVDCRRVVMCKSGLPASTKA